MLESVYQSRLIRELRERFPGCVILKNDTAYLQGIPDLTIFWGHLWAMLEVKASADAPVQPNQEYYVELMDGMSFAAFIHPENEAEVLRELEYAFQPVRNTRISKRQQVSLDQLHGREVVPDVSFIASGTPGYGTARARARARQTRR